MKYIINAVNKKSKIDKNIYGNFSEHLGRCIYEGLYVGEDSEIPNVKGMRKDVVGALKAMRLPVLRWPGGCFADEYHWRDGIGPKESRKKMINTHWGGVVEDNSFGTHEFFELCEQIGCEPYINGNVGSGTVAEMQDWVEYMTSGGISPMAELRRANGKEEPWKISYFGVGNENWGCGGNMRPEYYADEYRKFQTYLRNFDGNKIYKIACGSNSHDYNWTEVLMREAGRFMHGLSLHYYTIPTGDWSKKGSATDFTPELWYATLKSTLRMEELVTRHGLIMDKYDPQKKIAMIVDEWGAWCDVEPGTNPGFLYQQNSMRDALIAGINLNIFNKHSDRVRMANIAQLINVLAAVILTEGDKMILTPTYHVFEMYKEHQDATLVDSFIETSEIGIGDYKIPNVSESASIDENGNLVVTVCNMSLDETYNIESTVNGINISSIYGEILTGAMTAHNTFDSPEVVKKAEFKNAKIVSNCGFELAIPPVSVVKLIIK